MADAATLRALLTLKDEFSGGLDKAKGQLGGFAAEFEKHRKAIGIGMVAVGGAITGLAALSVKAAQEEQIGIARLDQALKNVGESYKALEPEIERVIAAQQRKTNYGDGEQRNALQKLITISGQYEASLKALPIVLDVAAGANIDLSAAALLVGKALAGETSSLTRYGIVVKEGASATEIMTALTKQFGGAAEAAANPFSQLKNVVGDLQEEIGSALLPIISSATQFFTRIIEKVIAFTQAHPALTKVLVIATAALGAVALVGGSLLLLLPALTAGVAAFGAVMTVALGPVGLITVAIAGLVTAGVMLQRNWDSVVAFFERAWAEIKKFFLRGVAGVLDTLDTFVGFLPVLGDKIDDAKLKISGMIDNIEMERRAEAATKTLQDMLAEERDLLHGQATTLAESREKQNATQRKATERLYQAEAALADEFIQKALENDAALIESELKKQEILREEAQETYDQQINLIREHYGVLEDSHRSQMDLVREQVEAARDALDERLKLQQDAVSQEIKAIQDAAKADIAALEDRARIYRNKAYERLDLIDEVMLAEIRAVDPATAAIIEGINKEIAAIQGRTEARDEAQAIQHRAQLQATMEEALFQAEVNNWRDNTLNENYRRLALELAAYDDTRQREGLIEERNNAISKLGMAEVFEAKASGIKETSEAQIAGLNAELATFTATISQMATALQTALEDQLKRLEMERLAAEDAAKKKLEAVVGFVAESTKEATKLPNLGAGLFSGIEGMASVAIGAVQGFIGSVALGLADLLATIGANPELEMLAKEKGLPIPAPGAAPAVSKTELDALMATIAENPELALLKFQHGGMIKEPTLLTSLRTRRPYAIAGEGGPELVVPTRGGGTPPMSAGGYPTGVRGGGLTLNFNAPIYGLEDFRRVVVEAVKDAVLRGGFYGVLAPAR